MPFAWARIALSKDVAFKARERVTSIVCPRYRTTTSSTPLWRIQVDPPAFTRVVAVWSPPPFSFADVSRVLSLQ
jgi:hypothetical protein